MGKDILIYGGYNWLGYELTTNIIKNDLFTNIIIIDNMQNFLKKDNISGIFNVGTGQARTFNDLVYNVYKNMKKNINIRYVEMPKEIKNQYQYHTEANLRKLIKTGFEKNFFTLEDGIEDYINNYLNKKNYDIS